MNDNDILPSPFFEYWSKTNGKNIEFMDGYTWILNDEQINALKYGQKDVDIYSDAFYFALSDDEKLQFMIGIRNISSSKYTGFRLEIFKTSKPINGIFSICVYEICYIDNACPFRNQSSGQYYNMFCFEARCLEKVSNSLTVRVAVKFELA